jgi:hypothetical protein
MPYCSLTILGKYLKERGSNPEPLFLDSSGVPISIAQDQFYQKTLQFIQLPPSLYKSHSFHIGACTQTIMSGIPEEQVKSIGRWKPLCVSKIY